MNCAKTAAMVLFHMWRSVISIGRTGGLIDFDIPDDLKGYLKYIADHYEEIESYLAYKRSEEYETTPAGRLEKELRRYGSMSVYDDIFIPAMCQLSESYRKYHEGLSVVNEMLLQKYPEPE